MRLSTIAIFASTFAAGAGLSLIAAVFAVNVIEVNSERGVRRALDLAEMPWAEVQADGLQVYLSGTAPTEALRFKAMTTAGTIVDAARIIDQLDVTAAFHTTAPRFSIEILRNDAGISLIGLVPAQTDREALLAALTPLSADGTVTDLLESADYPVPEGWGDSVDYAVDALGRLPRAKISVGAGQVSVTAIADTPEAKRRLETELSRAAPAGMRLALEVSAPRPVITPFTLRFLIEDGVARFDACSADTPQARDRILRAATQAGIAAKADCVIGLGVPSPNWSTAAEMGIAAVAELGGGSVTFSDADVTLVAAAGTDQGLFDRVVGKLENGLPEVFALTSTLPRPVDATAEVPEFVATLSPEGIVQMRGRLSNDLSRTAAESFAKARFGSAAVTTGARLDDSLPRDWPVRVLAALEALSQLSNGVAIVTPTTVSVTGNTGNQNASAEVSRLLAAKLGDSSRFDIRVTYQEKLDPVLGLPTPDECEAEIRDILSTRKINFEPGSATPDANARGILSDIGDILKRCGDIGMEIGGHTDSQGRAEMNLQLSQNRADAVLAVLREMRVPTAGLTARGYGKDQPVADNGTEEGREANRRIEFKLVRGGSETTETGQDGLTTGQESSEASDQGDAGAEDAGAEEDTSNE